MRKSSWLALATLALVGPALGGDHFGQVEWQQNVEEGLSQARVRGVPAMLVFSAEW